MSSYYVADGFFFNFQGRTRGRSTAHAHAGIELHYCHEGEGFFRVSHRHESMEPGRFTLVYAPAFHRVVANPRRDYCRTVLILPADIVRTALALAQLENATFLPSPAEPLLQVMPSPCDHADLTRLFRQMWRVLRRDDDPYSPLIALYVAELLYILNRLHQVGSAREAVGGADHYYLVEEALRYIWNAPSFSLSVDTVAEYVGVSRGHLCRLFNEYLGTSPKEILLEQRMESARMELDDGKSVSEAAAACGYSDVSSFSRAFKRHFGTAPRDYVKGIRVAGAP